MKKLPLRCPCHLKSSLIQGENHYLCENKSCEHSKEDYAFPCVNTIPILISETRTDTVCSMEGNVTYVKRSLEKYRRLKKLISGESNTTKKNCEKFIAELFKKSRNPRVLVIGGGEEGAGTEKLWGQENVEIHSVDIYLSETVDVVCDGHYLPFKDNCYEGVWIQAVLEHVVEPTVVVNEIYRVLKIGAVVYAETPFMQQVHEGAYDFTRYTVLGHRYLFKKFDLIDLGGNKGPELVFAWSTRYLVWAIFRSRKLARLIGLIVGLIMRPLGKLVSEKSLYDASSGVYFMGEKSNKNSLTHKELIKLYKGQFNSSF